MKTVNEKRWYCPPQQEIIRTQMSASLMAGSTKDSTTEDFVNGGSIDEIFG